MTQPNPHVAAMSPYALADLGGAATISLAQNESLFPPSPTALKAGRDALAEGVLYPDPDWVKLRAAIAEVHDLDPVTILCGAGSMELIGAIIHAYTGPGDAILGTQFGYAFVATAAQQSQASYITAPEAGLSVSVDALINAATPQTKLVFLCNPGNPTGTVVAETDMLRLRASLADDVLLVIDQAYAEFCNHEQHRTEIFALPTKGNTIILRTFSKAYALAGARVGWGVFPLAVAENVRKLLNPNNISGVSQAMAAAAMTDQVYMGDVVKRTAEIRDAFIADCRTMGLTVQDSHTNFALLQFAHENTATRIDDALRAENLLLRGMGGYGLSHCLRATIGREEDMALAAEVLSNWSTS